MHIKSIRYIVVILFFQVAFMLSAQKADPPFLKYINHPWVDSVYNTLSQEEKIAQLIWIDAYSNREMGHEVYLANLIRKSGIGGVVFFEGTAGKQTEMLNYFQSISRVPLIFAEDGEWGLGMRLDKVPDYLVLE